MTDNDRYAPPTAPVADLPHRSVPPERPRQVRIAVLFLWISLALGIPAWALSAQRDPENTLGVVAVALTVLLFVLNGLLNVMVGRGRNWARIVSLILGLLALLFVLVPIDGPKPPGQVENAITAADLILEFAALYLLFTRPGSLWFGIRA